MLQSAKRRHRSHATHRRPWRFNLGRRAALRNRAQATRAGKGVDEDVEVFNRDKDWVLEAFTGETGLALDDGGPQEYFTDNWVHDSGFEGHELNVTTDEDDDGWSLEGFDEEEEIAAANEPIVHRKTKQRQQSDAVAAEPSPAVRALFASLPPHVLRQVQADDADDTSAPSSHDDARRREAAKHKTHRRLRIISGSAAGVRLFSPQGDQTRPMMEKVRGAVFNMILSQIGRTRFAEGSRWLDLFAGTGSVGIEALSRGAGEAHFVEMVPWVVRACLDANLELTSLTQRATIHTMKAEDFLRRVATTPRAAGGAFDFVSVCPPYLLVSYEELYDLLDVSPLLHPGSVVLVEYPRRLEHLIRPTLAGLKKVRDRKYGRTNVAVYLADDFGDADIYQ